MIPLTRRDWAAYLADSFIDFLQPRDRVLDFGAGEGFIAWYLAKKKGVRTKLLDIKNRNETPLPLEVYDGKNIPFAANSFDAVLSVAVLHHVPRSAQEDLLRQLGALAPRLIIIEDTPANFFELFINAIGDTIANVPRGVGMAYSYRSEKEWLEAFAKMGFRLVRAKRVAPWYPIHRTVFVLETTPPASASPTRPS